MSQYFRRGAPPVPLVGHEDFAHSFVLAIGAGGPNNVDTWGCPTAAINVEIPAGCAAIGDGFEDSVARNVGYEDSALELQTVDGHVARTVVDTYGVGVDHNVFVQLLDGFAGVGTIGLQTVGREDEDLAIGWADAYFLYLVGEQGAVAGGEVVEGLVAVGTHKVYAVGHGANPFAVGSVHHNLGYLHTVQQIVGQVCAIVAWHFHSVEDWSAIGEYFLVVGASEQTSIGAQPDESIAILDNSCSIGTHHLV